MRVLPVLWLVACVPQPGASVFDADGDVDGDSVPNAEDCAPEDAAIGAAATGHPDADGDGFGAVELSTSCVGSVADGTDCDDTLASINPMADEACGDDVDENCDGGAPACRWDGDEFAVSADYATTTGASDVHVAGAVLVDALDADSARRALITSDLVIAGPDDRWSITPSASAAGAMFPTGIGNVDRRSDDPFDDLAIGVTNGAAGAVFVIPGPITGPFAIDDVATRIDGPTGSGFGTSIAGLGLVDGDPLDDFAVGAPQDAAGSGCVYLFEGDDALTDGATLTSGDARDVFCGTGEDKSYGEAVFAAGDLDADGQRDLAVSAASTAEDVAFRLHLVGSDGDDFGTLYEGFDTENGDGAAHPLDVASVGDLSGDGLDDLIIATKGASIDTPGVVRVMEHAPFGELDPVYLGDQITSVMVGSTSFGATVEALGDYDRDGTPDFAVGAPDEAVAVDESNVGVVYIYSGDVYLTTPPDEYGVIPWMSYAARFSASAADHLGSALAGPGDLDGDGWPDLAVGSDASVRVFLGGTR